MKTKLKVGDTVKIISGTYKNEVGNIIEIIHKPKNKCKAIVSGINMVIKHLSPEKVRVENYIYVDKLVKVRSRTIKGS